MALRDGFERVLSEYQVASQETFTQHALANYIRRELRDAVAKAAGDNERLLFKGSAARVTGRAVLGWPSLISSLRLVHKVVITRFICFARI